MINGIDEIILKIVIFSGGKSNMNKVIKKGNYKAIHNCAVFRKKNNNISKIQIEQREIELLIAQYYLNKMSDIPIMDITIQ